jgi:hypothetical protein
MSRPGTPSPWCRAPTRSSTTTARPPARRWSCPTSTNWTYSNLRTNNTHASGATLEAAIAATKVTGNLRVLSGTLSNGGFAISLANGKTFEVANGATFRLTGTSGMVTAASGSITKTFGATSTVDYAGSTPDRQRRGSTAT